MLLLSLALFLILFLRRRKRRSNSSPLPLHHHAFEEPKIPRTSSGVSELGEGKAFLEMDGGEKGWRRRGDVVEMDGYGVGSRREPVELDAAG